MEKRRKRIPLQRVEPKGKPIIYQITGWNTFLTWMFCWGGLWAMSSIWESLRPSMTEPVIMAVLGIGVCVLAEIFERRSRFSTGLLILPWLILLIQERPAGWIRGAKAWVNVVITRWNLANEGGTALFTVQASKSDILVITALAAVALAEISWVLIKGRYLAGSILYCVILMAVQLIANRFSPAASGALFVALLGIAMSDADSGATKNCLKWLAFSAILFFTCATVLPKGELEAVSRFRENVKQSIREARYGKDSLPEGDLREAAQLQKSDQTMLTVETEQQKNLYLRGFVGGIYENGIWKQMPDLVYGGENAGMLDWLAKKGFDPLTQVADYYRVGGSEDAPESNRVIIQTKEASRYYLYAPSSLKEVTKGRVGEKKDTRLYSKGLIGIHNYTEEEVSSTRPSELMVAEDWVSNPKTDLQKDYSEAEAVYRKFVYDNYLETDEELSDLIQKMFWDDYESESDGIYSAVSRIREVLKDETVYSENPEKAPDEEDPVAYFLTGSGKGNSMLYASAAVEAFRAHGIPARYVEGYYLSEKDAILDEGEAATLTGKNAHAWAEVYFDGIGWMPVDTTPGYYYDAVALQEMVSIPDSVQKNASLQPNDNGADPVTGDGAASRKKDRLKIAKSVAKIIFGLIGILLILLVILLVVIEVVRVFGIWYIRKTYHRASEEEQVIKAEKIICYYLKIRGIETRLGWKTDEVDRKVADVFPNIREGEYRRVCSLIEKTVYGGIPLEAFEKRTLGGFLRKLTIREQKYNLRMRMELRYACLAFLGK